MKRFVATLVFLVSSIYLLTSSVNAQYGQYGGPGPSLSILIDKMVGKPITNKGGADLEYVDNFSPSDPRFQAENDVWFRLKIKNTSNIKMKDVTVKDFVPSYLEPIEGPGTYDSGTQVITLWGGDFDPNEERVFYLKMRILKQHQLPSDKGLFCVINKVQAYNDKASDEDTAQLCIEKQVQGIVKGASKVPSAGPEMGIILLAGQLFTLSAGLYLKRKAS